MPRCRLLLVVLAPLALLAACGGDSLVLPDESAPARIVVVSGANQTAAAGASLPDSLAFRVTDSKDRPVVGQELALAAGSGAIASPDTIFTDANGRAAAAWTLGLTVGPQALTVAVAGVNAGSGLSVTVTATASGGPAGPGQLSIVAEPTASRSGVAFPQQPRVQLRDAAGAPLAVAGVAITGAIASGPTGSALIGGTTAATDGSGIATFTGLGIGGPVGTYTIRFGSASSAPVVSAPVTVSAGDANRLAVTIQPSSAAFSGTPFPQQPVVQLLDASGNPVPQAGLSVTAAIASGGGTLGGTATRSTDAGGRATFTNLAISGATGTRTLAFIATGLASATSSAIAVTASVPSASKSQVTASPGSVAGSETSTITVTVLDDAGKPVPGAVVTLSVTGGAFNTLTQPSAATGADGVAVGAFSSAVPGTRTISATVNGTLAITQHASVKVR